MGKPPSSLDSKSLGHGGQEICWIGVTGRTDELTNVGSGCVREEDGNIDAPDAY